MQKAKSIRDAETIITVKKDDDEEKEKKMAEKANSIHFKVKLFFSLALINDLTEKRVKATIFFSFGRDTLILVKKKPQNSFLIVLHVDHNETFFFLPKERNVSICPAGNEEDEKK